MHAFLNVAGFNLTFEERILYLNPIRDIFDDTGWMDGRIRDGTRIAIVGVDIETIMNRIRDPTRFWTRRKLNVWLIIVKTVENLSPPRGAVADTRRMVQDAAQAQGHVWLYERKQL